MKIRCRYIWYHRWWLSYVFKISKVRMREKLWRMR